MEKAKARQSTKNSPFDRLQVSALEADLAYFDARLELVGHPTSLNQQAQVRTFQVLNQAFTRTLHGLKRKQTSRKKGDSFPGNS